jgi:hypothetical protein
VFLPGVIIEQPIITWEQRTQLFEQIQKRINFSKRHANFDYLLRSMIECEEHIGSKGKHLKYRGCPLHGSYGYACDGGDEHSRHHFIQGPKIEEAVKKAFRELFASPLTAGTLWENISNLDKINKPELEAELKKLQSKLSKAYQNEAKLEESRINGLKSEVWELLNTKFQVQRKALEEGIRETQNLLDSASANEVKAASWKEIKDRFIVGSNKFTQTQWRNLLEEVSCRILVISSQNADWSQILESFDKTSEIPRKLKMESEYHAAITFLHDFDAIMFLKAPYQVQPQKVADIGLSMA